jgi:hypothetical protein
MSSIEQRGWWYRFIVWYGACLDEPALHAAADPDGIADLESWLSIRPERANEPTRDKESG